MLVVMSRPSCIVNVADVPGEKRPRFTATPGVAAIVRTLSDAAGLKQMGVSWRAVEPGFAGTNRHFHSIEEEWSYVLSGRGTLRIGPLRIPVSAGTFAGFPTGPRPHHFLAEGDEPLVFLEGGERRPAQDECWYPDIRTMSRGRVKVEPYVEPPSEEGDMSQVVRVHDVEVRNFQHDVDPAVRREMRTLHRPTGLTRQAVHWARVPAGGRSTVLHTHDRTDEWVFVLSGRGMARLGSERFEIGPQDFLAHPAGGAPHQMEAIDELTYLVGGQVDAGDVVTYPEAGLQRVGGKLRPGR
jgi:quercetin 2,3-dioxygenase